MQLFQRFPWPGNFRQLFNLLRTAVVMAHGCEAIALQHLPDDFLEEVHSMGLGMAAPMAELPALALAPVAPAAPMWIETTVAPAPAKLDQLSLDAISHALRSHSGNVSAAAKALGVSRNTIYRKKSQLPEDLWD
jgi:transcriptional regulator of acetoin/glycerol metabolism